MPFFEQFFIDKEPGSDWVVTVRVNGNPELIPVTVFGGNEERARLEAVRSVFEAEADIIEIISVEEYPDPDSPPR